MATKKGKGDKGQGRKRLNCWISHEAHERLGIHCVKAGRAPGRLVEELINAHLREWTVRRLNAASGDPGDNGGNTDGAAPPLRGL